MLLSPFPRAFRRTTHLPGRRPSAVLGIAVSSTLLLPLSAASAAPVTGNPRAAAAAAAGRPTRVAGQPVHRHHQQRATTSPAPTCRSAWCSGARTPPSRPDGGGYEYNDSSITGFSLTHLSGPGCGAEGDVPILPTVGTVNTSATDAFSHSNESADAGYYQVALDNGVTTELTATTRTGMAQFTFPATTQANLIFKLDGSQNGDSATSFTVVSNTEVQGSVTSGNFCGAGNTYTVYFDMQFNQPFATNGTFDRGRSPGRRPAA